MLKLKGIKRVSGETKSLKGYYSGIYLQLNVDKKTGEVWTNLHNSFGHNSWTTYRDEDVVVAETSTRQKRCRKSEISYMRRCPITNKETMVNNHLYTMYGRKR